MLKKGLRGGWLLRTCFGRQNLLGEKLCSSLMRAPGPRTALEVCVAAIKPSPPNKNSEVFMEALRGGDLMLSSTFVYLDAPYDQSTWRSTADRWHQIDYFAIPQSWQPSLRHVAPPVELDVAWAKIDHVATCVKVCVAPMVTGGPGEPVAHRRLRHSRWSFAD